MNQDGAVDDVIDVTDEVTEVATDDVADATTDNVAVIAVEAIRDATKIDDKTTGAEMLEQTLDNKALRSKDFDNDTLQPCVYSCDSSKKRAYYGGVVKFARKLALPHIHSVLVMFFLFVGIGYARQMATGNPC